VEKLDKETVAGFFDKRAELYGKIPTLNIAMFQEKQGDLAQKRNEIEWEAIWGLLKPEWEGNETVLDIGCGTGRLSFRIAQVSKGVVGFDVAPGLIEICNQERLRRGILNTGFLVRSMDDFRFGRFRLLLISGVSLYTEDSMWPGIMYCIRHSCRVGTRIVLRETVGSKGRYELHGAWSEELGTTYSAIYRDPDWFRALFGQFCDCLYDEPLLPPSLEKWSETHQRLMLWKVGNDV